MQPRYLCTQGLQDKTNDSRKAHSLARVVSCAQHMFSRRWSSVFGVLHPSLGHSYTLYMCTRAELEWRMSMQSDLCSIGCLSFCGIRPSCERRCSFASDFCILPTRNSGAQLGLSTYTNTCIFAQCPTIQLKLHGCAQEVSICFSLVDATTSIGDPD